MPRELAADTTSDDHRLEAHYTRARLVDDPRTRALERLTAQWLPRIETVDAAMREVSREEMYVDAARMGGDQALDQVSTDFGHRLDTAVNRDHTSGRWLGHFRVAPSSFIRQPLHEEVATVRGWLVRPDPVIVPLVPEFEAALARIDAATVREAALAARRGEVWTAREELATHINHTRQELESELEALARAEGLSKRWVASFFRAARSRPAAAE